MIIKRIALRNKCIGNRTAHNNALKFALAVWGQAYEEAKAHDSVNRVGGLSAEDKSYLNQQTTTCKAEARLECGTLSKIGHKVEPSGAY